MNKTLLECPTCQTAYPAERLRVPIIVDTSTTATVMCAVCGKPFDAFINPTAPLGWFRRVVLRQTRATHTVETALRAE